MDSAVGDYRVCVADTGYIFTGRPVLQGKGSLVNHLTSALQNNQRRSHGLPTANKICRQSSETTASRQEKLHREGAQKGLGSGARWPGFKSHR